MMFNWHSATIVSDLLKIKNVTKIVNQGQGGDIDSDNLVIYVRGCEDKLFVNGFNTPDEDDIETPGSCGVEMVELSDGLDSRGGLNTTDGTVAMVYMRVRQYFIDKGAIVVPTHKEYW